MTFCFLPLRQSAARTHGGMWKARGTPLDPWWGSIPLLLASANAYIVGTVRWILVVDNPLGIGILSGQGDRWARYQVSLVQDATVANVKNVGYQWPMAQEERTRLRGVHQVGTDVLGIRTL